MVKTVHFYIGHTFVFGFFCIIGAVFGSMQKGEKKMEEVKSLNNFKEDLIEGEIEGIEKIDNLKDIDEIYEFAIENGYEFEKEELEDSDILDDIYDCVAGGTNADVSSTSLDV